MTEPMGRFTAVGAIGRGLDEAPVLRQGLGVTWLIAALAGTAVAGIFAACNSIIMVINPLLLGIGNILSPRTSRASHDGGLREVSRIVWKTTAILVGAVGAICLLIALLGAPAITLIYAIEGIDNVQTIIVLLAAANFFAAAAFAVDNGLMVAERPDMNFYASLIGLVGTLCIGAALTPIYGVAGTALGVLIGTFFNSVFQLSAFSALVGKPDLRPTRKG